MPATRPRPSSWIYCELSCVVKSTHLSVRCAPLARGSTGGATVSSAPGAFVRGTDRRWVSLVRPSRRCLRHGLREVDDDLIGTWVSVAALFGALIGSLLTVIAWRIPRGLALWSDRSATGAARPSFWVDVPLLRIRSGRVPGGGSDGIAVRPPLLELVTGALFAVVVLRVGVSWTLPAYLVLAAMAVLLSVIDLQHSRLPDAVVVPFAVAALLLLALSAEGQGTWQAFVRALVGAVILFVLYLILALISPSSLGMGDVKLAAVLGLYLAYSGWRTLMWGAAGGFVIAALAGIVLLAVRRVGRRTMVPFGPAMLLAAVAAVALGAP
jgi:leader peptidase (prepilin peptidase)/N-methyltransferase